MINNKQKAIIGVIILFVSAYFIFKYDAELEENVKNGLMMFSAIVSIFFINPYILEIFNYKNSEDLELKREFITKKRVILILGYIIGFLGLYFKINEINYFLFMDMIFVFLGAGLIFYAQKNMKE